MSREIKFRGWHKELKRMLYPPLDIDSMTNVRGDKPDGEWVEIKTKHMLPGDESICFPAHWTWDGRCYITGEYQDIEWMQFTGALDKDGKEIYEGDVLAWKPDIGDRVSIWSNVSGTVLWDKETFSFVVKYSDVDGDYLLSKTVPFSTVVHAIDLKVIGHKYEIPKPGGSTPKPCRKKAKSN